MFVCGSHLVSAILLVFTAMRWAKYAKGLRCHQNHDLFVSGEYSGDWPGFRPSSEEQPLLA
jgi:hypothetical protein